MSLSNESCANQNLTPFLSQINLSKASFMFVLVSLFLCYEMGVQVSPGVMTQYLIRDLQTDAAGLGLISGTYFITYTLMQIPAGLLFDRFPVRIVVVLPVLLCSLGCYFLSVSNTLWLAALARALMGLGSAFAFIAVLVVASEVFPPKWFALLTGLTQMLAAFGAMVGEAPLVPLVEQIGWRPTLRILALVGVLLATLIGGFVSYRKPRVACPPHEAGEFDIGIRKSLSLILGNRQTWVIAGYACLLWAPMAGFASLWGVPFIKQSLGVTDLTAASLVLGMWMGIAVGAPLLGWWSDCVKGRRTPLLVSALLGCVCFLLLLTGNSFPLWVVGALLFLIGASCSGQALSFASVRDQNQRQTLAAAMGFNNMAVVIAGAIFQPFIGKLIKLHWSGAMLEGIPSYSAQDYRFGLWLIGIGYIVSVGLAMAIRESYPKEEV